MRRGLVPSREQARQAVEWGRVLVAGAVADKAARLVSAADPIVVEGPGRRFVSRGGDKLDAGLRQFRVTVAGRRALDAGASTGGFTDCLLQWGASQVYAVDVGYGQLDPRLRADGRVEVFERTNVRTLTPGALSTNARPFLPVDLLTADLSFISVTLVARVLRSLVRTEGDLIVLVKPQFEAGRRDVSKGRGVVRDPTVWDQTVTTAASALESAGTGIMGIMPSPVLGPAGNVEFLVHAVAGVPTPPSAALGSLAEAAVSQAASLRPG